MISFLVLTMCLYFYPIINPKIAIVYIATGNYSVFWPVFYESMEKYFLPDYEKHYFVFSDQEIKGGKNVTHIYRKWHGFPNDSLDRFEMFVSIEKQLKSYQYTYFLNANSEVLQPVGREILPSRQQKLVVAMHPKYYRNANVYNYPYERRYFSTAYIPNGVGRYYVQGAFNGGRTQDYLKMSKTLVENIKKDKENGVMAIWHDESHLNKYILDEEPLYLTPNYVWANFDYTLYDQYVKENSIKIQMRDKRYYTKRGSKGLRSAPKLSREEEIRLDKFYIDRGNHFAYLSFDKSKNKYCFEDNQECVDVEKKENDLVLLWENAEPETFHYNNEMEAFFPNTPHEEFAKEQFTVNQGDWSDVMIYNAQTEKYCRSQNNDCALIQIDKSKIKLLWDKWPPETFVYDTDTDTYVKE